MNPATMSFQDLYFEMVKRGILPNGRSYVNGRNEYEHNANNNTPERQ